MFKKIILILTILKKNIQFFTLKIVDAIKKTTKYSHCYFNELTEKNLNIYRYEKVGQNRILLS